MKSNLKVSPTTPKPCWKNASCEEKELFFNILSYELEKLDLLNTLCEDVLCKNPDHLKAIDDYLINIVQVIEGACDAALPKANCKPHLKVDNKKVSTGWNDQVKPYQETAQFWFAVWVSAAGRPVNSQLHNLMKKTRNTYHFMIRKC